MNRTAVFFFTYFSYFFKLINKQTRRDLLSLITLGYASINLQKTLYFSVIKDHLKTTLMKSNFVENRGISLHIFYHYISKITVDPTQGAIRVHVACFNSVELTLFWTKHMKLEIR